MSLICLTDHYRFKRTQSFGDKVVFDRKSNKQLDQHNDENAIILFTLDSIHSTKASIVWAGQIRSKNKQLPIFALRMTWFLKNESDDLIDAIPRFFSQLLLDTEH